MIEKPARGVSGFLIHNSLNNTHFFRIYNPKNKREYKDYELRIEDLKIEIAIDESAALFEGEDRNWIGWSL